MPRSRRRRAAKPPETEQQRFVTALPDGEMARRIREFDWSATSLGSPDTWPVPLTTTLHLMLSMHHPMYIWWGPDLLCFYNDAYRELIGPDRHPGSLGRPGREVWAESGT